MARGYSATDEVGRTFAFVLGHDWGITDEILRDSPVVYNIDLRFIDSCFGVDIDVGKLRRSVADFTNSADNEPFAGILRCYTRCEEFRYTNEPAIVNIELNEPVKLTVLDSLIHEVFYKLMIRMMLSYDA